MRPARSSRRQDSNLRAPMRSSEILKNAERASFEAAARNKPLCHASLTHHIGDLNRFKMRGVSAGRCARRATPREHTTRYKRFLMPIVRSNPFLPKSADDHVAPDNPVRFIDALVDSLDLAAVKFMRVAATSRRTQRGHFGTGVAVNGDTRIGKR